MVTFRFFKRSFTLFFLAATVVTGNSVNAQLGPCAQLIGPDVPDLFVHGKKLKNKMFLEEKTFGSTDCNVVEGCIASPGTHLLLRFRTYTPNIGSADLYLGQPQNCPNIFVYSPCHGHYHFSGYAEYRLWTLEGYQTWVAQRDLSQPTNSGNNKVILDEALAEGELILGRKQGFCLQDVGSYPFDSVEPGPETYTCRNQGISVAWADNYGIRLDCQYIQMTGLPAATYVLEVHINSVHAIPESDTTNNSTAVRFDFDPDGPTGPSIQNLVLLN